ncbi:SAM-dependent methyltransferase [Anaerocolumna xylanovorans]|uniref:Cyclopropane fatty-acyl-phospholipid synthase n=1 Tax=Anaerocolumna xylanovorans DSM 12503 TaxID=1121345 RepID=A0A1M7YG34_9FIRM|nr:methyltransferase domain-containing protein [Anaerocolumna xylanovorans]SHO51604.1 Cyclopropane fatty-acyl-phospholipid synthase [Anaerocolumna xylanovorans DSM 12503]
MKNLKSKKYDNEFVKANMMGPNSMIVLENLLENVQLTSNMRVLDLGCGNGLTSIFLAKEYGLQVFAVDLWISASENYKRFSKMNLENQIIPIHADATQLPFADEYFDAVISVDAYHYFGSNDTYFDSNLSKILKKNALIAIAVPGMKYEMHNSIPDEMKPYWSKEAVTTWNSCEWWRKIFSKSDKIEIKSIREMDCFKEAWQDWFKTENSYAMADKLMLEIDNGRYMNLISIIGNRQQ